MALPSSARALLEVARPIRAPLIGLALWAAVGAIAEVAAAVSVVRMGRALIAGSEAITILGHSVALPLAVGLTVALVLTRLAVSLVVAFRGSRLTSRVEAGLRQRVIDALLHTSLDEAQAVDAGVVLQAATVHPNHLNQALAALVSGTTAATGVAVVTTAAIALGPVVTLAIGGPSALLLLAVRPLRRKSARLAAERVKAEIALASAVDEVVTVAREIRTFGVAGHVRQGLDVRLDHLFRLRFWTHVLTRTASDLAVGFVPLLAVASVVVLVRLDRFDEAWAAATFLLLRAAQQLTQLNQAVQLAVEALPAFRHLDSLVRAWPVAPAGAVGRCLGGDWQLVGISPDRGGKALSAPLSDVWRRASIVTVEGASGVGKTTLLHGLAGLRPLNGQVLVGGVPASAADLRASSAVVPQRAQMLETDVAANVRFLRQGIDEQAVFNALRRSGLDPLSWRDGLATQVTDRNLSGGERQRIAIARALLTNAPVLLLDEPTSGLDASNTAALVHTLQGLKREGTLIVVVSHDAAALGQVDGTVKLVPPTGPAAK